MVKLNSIPHLEGIKCEMRMYHPKPQQQAIRLT